LVWGRDTEENAGHANGRPGGRPSVRVVRTRGGGGRLGGAPPEVQPGDHEVNVPDYVNVDRAETPSCHNLRTEDATLDLSQLAAGDLEPLEIFADQEYEPLGAKLDPDHMAGLGYRWIRLREMAVGQR
jgi:hypothetical protein